MSQEIAFTRDEAPGALRNGTIVEKINSKPEDTHRDGARATILGSLGPLYSPTFACRYGYFVVWDDIPVVPVFIASERIRPPSRAN